MMHSFRLSCAVALAGGLALCQVSLAQDPKPGQPGYVSPFAQQRLAAGHFGGSPFAPPEANDATFVVDQGSGLDTGCTFHSGGPLVFTVKVGRVVGDIAKLKQNGMISATAELRMPAFDVDFDAFVPPFNPERDRVTFNGNVVPTEFLTGADNTWKLNSFRIPIEWVKFPADPGQGGTPAMEDNVVAIDVDTANSQDVWCTSIDWAALSIEVARPVVLAHGILSTGGTWSSIWVPQLTALGLPNTNELNMGKLDSIQNNAAKIGAVVASSRTRWGVDKVNIVSHSKGGLDSRHFVESNEGVEQVVQLGTPNAGSPLADAVEGASLYFLGGIPTIIINELAGPAGVQLTQPYMAFYNSFHGSNPNVRYTALAGDYNPNCFFLNIFCHPIDRLLLAITGRGDTVVPIRSVHALGYTQNRVFGSSGSDGQAKHTSQTGSLGIFNTVRDRVQAFGRLSALTPDPAAATSGHTATAGAFITQGQIKTQIVPIDSAAPAFFSLAYPSGDLSMALISPSGRRYDPTTIVGDPNVSHEKAEILGGFLEVYDFAAPEVGVWTVEVKATSVTAAGGTVAYAVHAWFESPAITLTGGVLKPSVHSGEPLDLTATVRRAGVPLSGATAVARIALPDDTAREVALHDDGVAPDLVAEDGIYTGRLTDTTQPGLYRVAVRASGTAPAFSREDLALATVSQSSSTLAGTFRDRGEDTDGDGLFNQLVIDVDLNVTAPGSYRLFGVLTDSAGNQHEAHAVSTLAAGAATISLRFDGAESLYALRGAPGRGKRHQPASPRREAGRFPHGGLRLPAVPARGDPADRQRLLGRGGHQRQWPLRPAQRRHRRRRHAARLL